ncbi:MAG: cysteine--tRNA ligase [Candidatus Gagatemarchaeaceae archaeon]
MLRLYNSMGRTVQPFRPIRDGEVRMYTCGPTVWNYAHIGNFRTYAFEDLLRRFLLFKGFRVTQVMNITDVEDNIIKGIKLSGKPLGALTSFYTTAFMEDLSALGIQKAEVYPRATEHIKEMVALVLRLLAKGDAYRAPDGSVYFDVSKFKEYGALSGVKPGAGKAAGRVAQDHYEEKMEAADFALWKAWDADDGEVFWETELGKGRPGWHIECSAMSMKYLGDTFDIHTGGLDNKFPHHENEIAQSEAATGKKFVNYWLHSAFLTVGGEAMHKSVGNVVYLRDLMKKGWDPLTVRLFLLSSRYRDPVDLTDKALKQSRAQRERLQDFIDRLKRVKGGPRAKGDLAGGLLSRFEGAMDDDLNAPQALAVLFTFVKSVNGKIDSSSLGRSGASEILAALERVNSVLGVMKFEGEGELPPELSNLLDQRNEAKKRKDFAEADRLREALLANGILLEDTPSGTRWKRAKSG